MVVSILCPEGLRGMMMTIMTTKMMTVTTEIITTMMGKKIIFSNLVYLIVSYSLVTSVGICFRGCVF